MGINPRSTKMNLREGERVCVWEHEEESRCGGEGERERGEWFHANTETRVIVYGFAYVWDDVSACIWLGFSNVRRLVECRWWERGN